MSTVHRLLKSIAWQDLAVYVLILLFGRLYFQYYLHFADFTTDAYYVELARSIIEKGAYQFDFRPETLLPPSLVRSFYCWP